MTEMPEKLSCEKSDRAEKASCLVSHLRRIFLPTTVPTAKRSIIGMRDKKVSIWFMFHIFHTESTPRRSASKNMRMPEPKQSCTVWRSFMNFAMRSPTLFT